MTTPVSLHASCVALGEAGVLIRGASGAGKSLLARELIVEARSIGWFARLVGDDRILMARRGGRVIARPSVAIAGRIEVRSVGVFAVDYEPAIVLRLVVDCSRERVQRLPESNEMETRLCDVPLPRIACLTGERFAGIVLLRLRDLNDTLMTQ